MLTARAIGLDYQQGTIRIILARGVERTQLLGAKLFTVATASLVTLVALLVYLALLGTVFVGLTAGNLNALSMLSSSFWPDTWTYVLTILVSMAATLMMATAASVIGKSLSFGLSVGLLFFPADNIGATVSAILYSLTNNDFWLKISAYLLGPNLNVLPSVLLPLATRTVTLQGWHDGGAAGARIFTGHHTLCQLRCHPFARGHRAVHYRFYRCGVRRDATARCARVSL